MKNIYLYIISLLIASALKVNAQQQQQLDPVKENVEYTVDDIGDGHVKLSHTFNASQWDNYKKIYGSNAPDLWKRQMTRNFPAAYLDNFSYKEEEMNRTFTLTFDAFGFAHINDNGQWQIDIAIKNPDITKISDRNYAMTSTYSTQGGLFQDLIKLNMPDAASNVTLDKNPLGKPIFTYDLTPPNKAAHMAYLIIGVLLIGGGALVYFKPDFLKKKVKVKPFTVITEQGQTPPKVITPEPPATNPNIEKQA